jgi:hypothetical protein
MPSGYWTHEIRVFIHLHELAFVARQRARDAPIEDLNRELQKEFHDASEWIRTRLDRAGKGEVE